MNKNDLQKIFTNKKGSVLLMTVFILTSILIVALATADLVLKQVKTDKVQVYSVKAFSASETGAERILWHLRKGNFNLSNCPMDGTECVVDFDNNTCSNDCEADLRIILSDGSYYIVKFQETSAEKLFRSIGYYNGARRAVEVSFSK